MASAQSGVISTVKYLLDHGVGLMKADVKGHVVLHNDVCAGTRHQGFFVMLVWLCTTLSLFLCIP